MRPPRLIGNTGESGEFVLPLNIPDKSGKLQSFDEENTALWQRFVAATRKTLDVGVRWRS